ncbi:MAG: DUF368 domain-containing protein [Candidatus Azobacteroides sp.]|nr:DUF368 domain-containing protein [Candidatus Azobacteroides sp.]
MDVKKRGFFSYVVLTLKGIAMGAADVIPGVSGGTIAFISGIYEELINSIKQLDGTAVKLFFSFKWKEGWKKINGKFLLAVFVGIGISIFSLAKLMTYLLNNYPIFTWSFFFGLIISSSLLVSKEVTRWKVSTIISLLVGITAAYLITVLSPASTPHTWWFIIISGAVAICAMILPGISGAFILLLMGQYAFLMDAVGNFNIKIILLFIFGAVIGLISFSHLLSFLLKNFHNAVIAVLTGFMVGSLNKIWPWKKVLETYVNRHGEVLPLVEKNISPFAYAEVPGADSYLWQAAFCCIAGFLLIFIIEKAGDKIKVGRTAEK